ncbi:MAG TPA: AraC family transcriptional regulator [Spirochaetota bacterium]
MAEIFFTYSDEVNGVSLVEGKGVSHRFPRHTHDSLCITLITDGRWTITRGDGSIGVDAGSSFIINSHEAHEAISPDESSYLSVCVKSASCAAFYAELGLPDAKPLYTRKTITDAELASLITNFAFLLQNLSPLIEKESAFGSLLGYIVSRYAEEVSVPEITPPAAAKGSLRAKEYIDAHLDEDISLQELTDAALVSPYYLTRSFTRIYGVPPHRYLLQTRIKRAQRELLAGKKIVDVALECGFFDQAHFSKLFLREVGITPGEFVMLNGSKS